LQGEWQLGAPLQRVAAVMLRELKLEFTPSNNPKQLQEPRQVNLTSKLSFGHLVAFLIDFSFSPDFFSNPSLHSSATGK
jgi:hypothetical protein